jgi:uncharacterized protein YbcV (DUF1398 family)
MDTTAIDECDRMSFADVPFPQVVARLAAAGVHSYRADLLRRQKTYYDQGAGSYDSPVPLGDAAPIGATFAEGDVVAAVRAIRRGEIGYAQFLHRIMTAGCASYCVFIRGRKTIYFGRDGQLYIENFPNPDA